MRNLFFIALIGLLFNSCTEQASFEDLRDTECAINVVGELTSHDKQVIDLALGIYKAGKINRDFSKIIKEKVVERFDGDYNVLLKDILDEQVQSNTKSGGTISFNDFLSSQLPVKTRSNVGVIEEIINKNPKIQIAIPVHADKWDGIAPLRIAILPEMYDEKLTKTIPCINTDGTIGEIDAINTPNEPVMVLSYNERILAPEVDEEDRPAQELLAPSISVSTTNLGIVISCDYEWGFPYPEFYHIYRTDELGEVVYIGSITGNTPFFDNSVNPNAFYYYYAYAANYVSTSPKSEVVRIQAPSFVKSAIEKFSVTVRNNHLVELRANYHNDVPMDRVVLFRSENNSPYYAEIHRSNERVYDFFDTQMEKGKRYHYKASTFYGGKESNPARDFCIVPYRNIEGHDLKILKIKCDAKGDIESWAKGEPEFNITAAFGNGTIIMNNTRLDLTSKETTFNHYVTLWTPVDWMETITFKLMEIDGGEDKNVSFTTSVNYKYDDNLSMSSGVSVSFKKNSGDEDCGQFTMSFYESERYYHCNGKGQVKVYMQ